MHATTDQETRSAPETGSAPGSTPAPRTGRPWRTALTGLLLLGTAGGMMAYGAPSRAAVPAPSRPAREGALASATLLQQVSAKSVRAELAGAHPAPGAPAPGAPALRGGEVRYGVDAHRVAYLTVDANGRPVLATGLVALPAGGPAGLPVVSYDHGTCAASADVPSPFGLGPDHSARVQSRVGFAVGRRVSVEI